MKADDYLVEKNIEFEEVVQENATKTCDDAARERGVDTSQIVKSLIVDSEGKLYHVLLPGDRELSEKKFGAEYRMVPPGRSKEITGFESGTVHPFSTDLDHLVDERIFENQRVSHTVGDDKRGVILDAEGFRSALEKSDFSFNVRDIAVSEDEDVEEIIDQGLGESDAKFIVESGKRSFFLDISEEFPPGDVLDLIKAAEREELDISRENAEKVLERSEDQTHLQRLVENLAEEGELPEKSDFDLEEAVSWVLDQNPDAVEDLQEGRESAVNYLIGQLMEETNGRADAGEARKIIMEEME